MEQNLENDMVYLLKNEQYSTVSYITSEIDEKISQRIELLDKNAKLIADMLNSPDQIREFLKGRFGLISLFQAGVVAIDKNGVGLVDYPMVPGRMGASFTELEYFKGVLATGKPSIGKPRLSRFTNKPIVGIAVPIRDHSNALIGVLAGYSTLSDKNLFGPLEQGMTAENSRVQVISPREKLIVSSSDKSDILQPLINLDVDIPNKNSFVSDEHSRIVLFQKETEALVTSKRLQSTDWVVRMILPTDKAFASVNNMKARGYAIAIVLTLFASFGIWVFILRVFQPLDSVAKSIRSMATDDKLSELALSGGGEIQELQRSFNLLVNQRNQLRLMAQESEARQTRAELASKSGNWEIHLDSRIVFASVGAIRIYELERQKYDLAAIQKFTLPEYREQLYSAFKNLIEKNKPYDIEFKIKTLASGEIKDIHSIAIFDKEKRIVFGVIQDITARKNAEQKLIVLAQTDMLTGLASRRHFMSLAEQELLRSRRYGRLLSLLMLDIDHFKNINDTYGHQTGDLVLKRLGAVLLDALRKIDFAGRIGGEEFVIILPETNAKDALVVAERIRKIVEETAIPLEYGLPLHIALSIGVTTLMDNSSNIDTLLGQADKALYEAKHTGRNRVCFHDIKYGQLRSTNSI